MISEPTHPPLTSTTAAPATRDAPPAPDRLFTLWTPTALPLLRVAAGTSAVLSLLLVRGLLFPQLPPILVFAAVGLLVGTHLVRRARAFTAARHHVVGLVAAGALQEALDVQRTNLERLRFETGQVAILLLDYVAILVRLGRLDEARALLTDLGHDPWLPRAAPWTPMAITLFASVVESLRGDVDAAHELLARAQARSHPRLCALSDCAEVALLAREMRFPDVASRAEPAWQQDVFAPLGTVRLGRALRLYASSTFETSDLRPEELARELRGAAVRWPELAQFLAGPLDERL